MGPLSVELMLEPHVYLHEAELVQDHGANARPQPQAYKDEICAVWRQIEALADNDEALAFEVCWRAIANAAPGAGYTAMITVRDARGALLAPCEGSQNPAQVRGQIGPAANPIDIGRCGVVVATGDSSS